MGQGAIQLQQSMLGPQEAAEVSRVQGHHHNDVVHTAQWKKGFDQDVLVWLFFQHLKRKSKTEYFFKTDNWYSACGHIGKDSFINVSLMARNEYSYNTLLNSTGLIQHSHFCLWKTWRDSHMKSAFSVISFASTSLVLLLFMTWHNRHCSIAAE